MNHTKLIHQFFDGEIEGADEEALFSALAGDRELRREFVEHLQISSFIQHDTIRTGPPAELSNAVFAAIGLPQPGAPFTQNDESAWQKLGVLIHRILPFLATIFITGAVTSGVFLLSDQSYYTADSAAPAVRMMTKGAENNTSVSAENSPMSPVSSESMQETAPIQNYAQTSASQQPPTYEGASIREPVSHTSYGTPGMHNAAPGPGPDLTYAEQMALLPDYTVPLAPVVLQPASSLAHKESHDAFQLVGMPYGQTPFTIANVIVQLRIVGLQGAYPNTGLTAPTQGIFRDMAITGLYKLSERHALGITYGREPIGRIYTRMVVDKNRTNVETGPVDPKDMIPAEFRDYDMLDWGGVTWKMSHTNIGILRTFYPFTEITAAVSKYGPIGRAMFGIELYPSNASMLNVGVELTSLAYTIEDKMYTSTKLGGSFGVALSF